MIPWSPDGKYIATGDQDSTVHFWIMSTGDDLQMSGYPTKVRGRRSLAVHEGALAAGVTSLVWAPNDQYIAVGDESGGVSVFSIS